MKNRLFCLFLILIPSFLSAQVITSSPYFFGGQDSVTIYFDATQGNGALENFTGPIYAHTGVITSAGGGWRYVKSAWGVADTNVLMTSLGNNLYSISFVPRTYYNVPSSEVILQLAFLFRNVNGSIVTRNSDGSDIFIDLKDSTHINCAIVDPVAANNSTLLVNPGQSISITGIADTIAGLSFLLNGSAIASVTDDTLTSSFTPSSSGNNTLQLIASDGSTADTSEINFLLIPSTPIAAVPVGAKDGVTYLNDSTVIFNLFAPHKEFVYLLGDFNNWTIDPAYLMNRTPDTTRYWIQITGLQAQQEYVYQYLIDGTLKIADPYSEKIVDPSNDGGIGSTTYPNPTAYPTGLTTGIATVLQTAQVPYQWQTNNFQKPEKTDLIIYELLVRDFITAHNYKTLIDTLNYLQTLGINAIELMPVSEFEANNSWGYNPSFMFANDKYYGTKDMLKAFIDTCHSRGIAVIMDIVLNHQCGTSPMVQMYFDNSTGKPSNESPWFNTDPTHDFNVCYDMNHDSPDTRYFVDRVTEFWIQQFHFDGYRFDLAKGFTQTYSLGNVSLWGHYDSSRVYNIERMANHIWSIDTNAYVILEMFADNSEEQHYSNDGMMLWGNVNYNYYMATMGNVSASNFSSVNYKAHGWSKPHLIGYMESHDEERVMYKNLTSGYSSGTYNVKDTATALRRMEMAGAFFYTVPGPKMAWMGGELGYDISINNPCRTCSHPFKWNYYSRPNSLRLYKVWSAIINLRNDYPAFRTTNFNMQTSQAGKSIHLNDSAMNVTIVGNFDVNAISFNPVFQNTGWWYDYLTGDSIEVLNTTSPLALEPGEYHIYTTVKLSTPNLSIGIAETEAEDNFAYAFPNPANSFTSFGMYLSKSSNVRIEIYRINGQKIDEIDAGRLSPGEHMIDWSFADKELASGLYICRISAGNQTQHIKIVID